MVPRVDLGSLSVKGVGDFRFVRREFLRKRLTGVKEGQGLRGSKEVDEWHLALLRRGIFSDNMIHNIKKNIPFEPLLLFISLRNLTRRPQVP